MISTPWWAAATAPPNTTRRIEKFGTDQVIPLWIADMDFKTAQPSIDALTARAQEASGLYQPPGLYFEAIRK